MPVAANPFQTDFYVYQYHVDAYPFYVGVGRSQRGPDRVRYVRSLMTPHNAAKLAKSSFNNQVIAALLLLGIEPSYSRTSDLLTRLEALAVERGQLAQLLARGYLLTNWQHNPLRHRDVSKAVRAIVSKQMVQLSN
jgi:hypothetical protein